MTNGAVFSKAWPGDGTNDYEAQITLSLPGVNAAASYWVRARMADGNNYYSFSMSPVVLNGACAGTFTLEKVVAATHTTLTSFLYPCHDGMKMGLRPKGNTVTISIDSVYSYTITDGSLTSGGPAVGMGQSGSPTTSISKAEIGTIDRTAPGAVSSGSIVTSAFATRVDLKWTAPADDYTGSGVVQYQISRGGVVLGTSGTPTFTDDTVTATTGSTTYSIVAMDRHGNTGSATTKVVSVPSTVTGGRRIGVRGTGSYWGAAGEQVDLVSGNLNFSLPTARGCISERSSRRDKS